MSSAFLANWRPILSNVPPLTKTVVTAMTVMTALGLAVRFRDLAISDRETDGSTYVESETALIPLVALVPALWHHIDSGLLQQLLFSNETSLWQVEHSIMNLCLCTTYAINTIIMLGCGKYLERSWGSRELFKVLSISSIGTMVGIYMTCLVEYAICGNDELLYDTRAYGLTGVVAGFIIGFKQLVPDHLITLWGVISIRVKSLPLLFAIIMVVEGYISQSQINFLMAIYGLFISWIYSRFFRVQDGIRGDRSETFSFASFFPELIQPVVKAFSNFCFGVLVKLHICTPTGYGGSFQYDLENPQMTGMGHTFTRPGSLRAEAERRRALALKALDMRLHAAAGISSTFSGTGRSQSSTAAPVSLLSLSAEPLPVAADGDDDEVLFESTVLDMNDAAPPTRPKATAGSEPKTDKENQ
ncbi:hypothetical protein BGX20_007581 [Mortierella sp. AD010]|nr:hypothetical protein BGX20_007581 [Mortierella sp. AD010]